MVTGSELRRQREQLGLSQAKLAEVTRLPQHLLSAFELGKISLSAHDLSIVQAIMGDRDKVLTISRRVKRYRQHTYAQPPVLSERKSKAQQTSGNAEYLDLLQTLHNLHIAKKSEKLSALSVFSGCGGLSLGFSAAGFLVRGFVEIEKPLRAIYKKNFPDSMEIGGDIASISDVTLAAHAKSIGPLDVIIGGPPCQGFSLSGKRRTDDPRNQLFRDYLRFVDAFRPRFAVLENVRLLTSMKNLAGGYIRDDIRREFQRHGYKVRFFEINAKDYGVPQHRERVIFVAVRDDIPHAPSLPPVSHGAGEDIFRLPKFRSFGDACSDLEFMESGGESADPLHKAVTHPSHVIHWLWDVPEGDSAHDNVFPEMRPPSGYNTTYKRQIWKEPGATVQTTFGMISGCRNVHPIATRSLTIREAARLQSFPDEYRFVGTSGDIRTGIGNAVPPVLAHTIALHIKQML